MEKKKLPSGALTFLFSDIEGSTARWERDRAAMTRAVQRHDEIMRTAIGANNGHVFKTIGDAFCVAFGRPEHAVDAALNAQRALSGEDFSAVDGLHVRMALHSGNADERDGDYFGPALNRIARIMSIVHGGQVVLSDVTSDLVRATLPPDTSLVDLGAHRLKDLGESQRLYQLIIEDLPSEFPMLRSLELLPNNLPQQLTRLIGRDDELAATEALVKESRLVTLIGAGGIGKTRLALQVGSTLLDGFPDGVWFIDLAPLRDPEQVPSAVAEALNVKETAAHSLTDSLVSHLRSKALLLIHDNCEHLIAGAAKLSAALLRECREIQILATSRQPLAIAGERVHRLSTLAVPPFGVPVSKETALHYGAIALFVDRARIATDSFELTDANAGTIAEICRHLDGIALAIELAAPRLKLLTIEQLNERLSERFRVLTGGSRDALPRQQTMRALIDWSYDLLDDDEQQLFRRMCVFAGDFSPEAATAVATDATRDEWGVVELLFSLVDKSLLTSELADSQRRYRLLESVREYAVEKAGERDELAALRLLHAEYYAGIAQSSETARRSAASTTEWVRELVPDLPNFRAALDWGLSEYGKLELGVKLLCTLDAFWYAHGLAAETARRAEGAIALASGMPEPLQADLWCNLATSREILARPSQALEAATRACELYQKLGDQTKLAQALRLRGNARVSLNDFDEGQKDLERSLALFHEMGDRNGEARAMISIALTLKILGRLNEAAVIERSVTELYRDLGENRELCVVQLNVAEGEFALGQTANAVEVANDNLASEVLRMDAVLRSQQESNLAAYLLALDQKDEARRIALQAIRSAREANHQVYAAHALQHLAAIIAPRDPGCAARVLGYVEDAFKSAAFTREATERFTHDRLMATLRETFTDDEIAALAHEGATLTEDQAIELAQAAATDEAHAVPDE